MYAIGGTGVEGKAVIGGKRVGRQGLGEDEGAVPLHERGPGDVALGVLQAGSRIGALLLTVRTWSHRESNDIAPVLVDDFARKRISPLFRA